MGTAARRMRLGWLVMAVVAGAAVGLIVGSVALGDASGPTLTVDQGFNSGQPVAPQFAPDGPGGSPGGVLFASAIQPDGKVIVVGQNEVGTTTPIVKFDVARYNADGTLDTSFGTNGYVQVAPTPNSSNFAAAVALDPSNGDILVAGGDTSGPDVPELVGLTPSGALDSSFGTNGAVVDSADPGSFLVGVVVDSAHRIVTLGSDGVVRRYTSNGSVDSTFGTGGHTGALVSNPAVGSNVLALQPADGKILVAGTSSGKGAVVRLNTDGTPDSTFGSAGTETLATGTMIRQMTLEGTSIVVGGNDANGNGILARLTSNGAVDTSFGTASGYTILSPPGGTTEHVDALFSDPGSPPGLIYCLYQSKTGSQTGVCSSLGVDGQTMGANVTITGTPKDGGYSFTPNSHLTNLSYLGAGVYTTGPGTGPGTTGCPPITFTFTAPSQPFPTGTPVTFFIGVQGGSPPYQLTVQESWGLGLPMRSDGTVHVPGFTYPTHDYVIASGTDSNGCPIQRSIFTFDFAYPPASTTAVTPKGGPKPPVHPLTDEEKTALKSKQNWALGKSLALSAVQFVSIGAWLESAETGIGDVVFGSLASVAGGASAQYAEDYLELEYELSLDPPDPTTHQVGLPHVAGRVAVRDRCSTLHGSARNRCDRVVAGLRSLIDDLHLQLAADKAIVAAQNRFGSARVTGDGVGLDLQYAAVKTELGIETDALAAAQADSRRLAAALRTIDPRGRFPLSVAALVKAGDKQATAPEDFLAQITAPPPLAELRSEYLTMNGFDLSYLVEALADQRDLSKAHAKALEQDANTIRHIRRGKGLPQAIARFVRDASAGSPAATTPAGFLQAAARGIR